RRYTMSLRDSSSDVCSSDLFRVGTTWGVAKTDDGDNIVWGTACESADCDNIVWGTEDGDNIVWGTAGDGDNIVWGTADGDNIVRWAERRVGRGGGGDAAGGG